MSPAPRAPWRRALLLAAGCCALLTMMLPLVAPAQVTLLPWTRLLASGLLLVFAVTTSDAISPWYRALVSLGLLAQLVADQLLLQPSDPLLAALACALVALVACFAAFVLQAAPLRYKAGVVGYAAVATVVLALVLPVIGGPLRSTLVAYVIALALTASQAASWMLEDLGSRSARLAAFGLSCLVAANAVFALDRFVFIVPARDLLVLTPYWIALAALALSVERPPPPALRL
jgi:uncharacterized membrane protein YhhN